MLGHLTGYLFGGAEGSPAAAPETVAPCRELQLEDPELDEWVMVAEGATPGATPGVTPACSTSPSTPTSQLTVDDNWTLTPPACFGAAAGRPPLPPASSLENLLIEHPSMSVYVRGGRPAPAPVARTPSPPAAAPAPRPSAAAAARRAAHGPGPAVPAAQLQRLAIQQAQKHATRNGQKFLRPSTLERNNLVRHVAAAGNQRPRRQHHYTTRHSGANNNRRC